MTTEEWRLCTISNLYEISSLGNCRRTGTSNNLCKNKNSKSGYVSYHLSIGGQEHRCSAHRLVALAFLPNEENKPQVNHINRIRDDNRVENLCWATKSENMNHVAANRNSVTGHRGINLQKQKNCNYYVIIHKPRNPITKKQRPTFSRCLRCDQYTLEDAIALRNELYTKHGIPILD